MDQEAQLIIPVQRTADFEMEVVDFAAAGAGVAALAVLADAGTSIGNQLNRATTATVKSGASAYVGAWLDALEPGMIARLDARYRRTGQAQ